MTKPINLESIAARLEKEMDEEQVRIKDGLEVISSLIKAGSLDQIHVYLATKTGSHEASLTLDALYHLFKMKDAGQI